MSNVNGQLVPVGPLQSALAAATEAGDIDAMRDVHSMASALRKGAQSRGLGVEAENAAAVVILRSERAIGRVLEALREEGRFGNEGKPVAESWGSTKYDSLRRLVEVLRDRPMTYKEASKVVGRRPGVVAPQLSSYPFFEQVGDERPAPYHVNEAEFAAWLARFAGHVAIKDLGISEWQVASYQRLARISDDEFERMLSAAQEHNQRIAKVNFYAWKRGTGVADASKPVVPGYDELRRGAMELLGWQGNKEGKPGPTRNGLMQLADDELVLLRQLVQALADAYGEVAKARRVQALADAYGEAAKARRP